jgi:hypothetical protein
MTNRFRPAIALLSVALLMFMQVAPAVAVCLCDLPAGESCCDNHDHRETAKAVVESAPGPGGCCSEEPAPVAEPLPSAHCSEMRTDADGQVSLSPPACKSDLVSADLTSAVLPMESLIGASRFADALATLPVCEDALVAALAARQDCLRGPPNAVGPPGPPRNGPLLL